MVQQRKVMIEQLNVFTKSLQIGIQTQLFTSYASIFMTLVKHPDLQEVNKHDEFIMSKPVAERTRYVFYDLIIAINEVLYVLYRNTLADEKEWRAWKEWLRYWMGNDEFREVVKNSYDMYREDYVEDVLKRLVAEVQDKPK